MASVGWAHLCDYAFFDRDGKVCLIGIFKIIVAPRIPTQHTRCAFVFQLQGQPNEVVKIRLQIVRPDGKDPLIDLTNPNLKLNTAGELINIMGLDNLPLPDFGPYEIKINLNDTLTYVTVFEVRRLEIGGRP